MKRLFQSLRCLLGAHPSGDTTSSIVAFSNAVRLEALHCNACGRCLGLKDLP